MNNSVRKDSESAIKTTKFLFSINAQWFFSVVRPSGEILKEIDLERNHFRDFSESEVLICDFQCQKC